MQSEAEIIKLIEEYANSAGETPTIKAFSDRYGFYASSIVRKYGSWNNLLKKANLKPNKADTRSTEQLLLWLKSHPDARYQEIPLGIRSRLETKYNSISEARKAAGLRVTDWRTATRRRKYIKSSNSGRPIEFTEDKIIEGLQKLAIEFGRPPRICDITKKRCGFTPAVVIARFGSLNSALQAASLPIVNSYQEQNKLIKELEILVLNAKLVLGDIPCFFNFEDDTLKPTFVYLNHCELVRLKRSDINEEEIIKYKKTFGKVIIWYLVDDSLQDSANASIICTMDLISNLSGNKIVVAEKLMSLRKQYDELTRVYVGQPVIEKMV